MPAPLTEAAVRRIVQEEIEAQEKRQNAAISAALNRTRTILDRIEPEGKFIAVLTAKQEARVREIAIEVAVAVTRIQAGHAAGEAIDRYRVSAGEVTALLAGDLHPLDASETSVG